MIYDSEINNINNVNKLLDMENGKKISELPEMAQLTGNEEIPVEVGGKNGRIKSGMFQTKGDYALKDEMPDTSNFITNTVNNLANYYLKQETYTKQEVVALINQITTINFKVVDVLPDTGEANLIYLVKKEGSGDDVHDEYIWVEEKWEKIGSTSVDLTNYYTKTDADDRFALKIAIADMLTKTEAAGTYITEAPKDGKVYNRSNAQWVEVVEDPTTYSYLTGTAEPTEQVGGTTEEWQDLVTTAAEKQISFATE